MRNASALALKEKKNRGRGFWSRDEQELEELRAELKDSRLRKGEEKKDDADNRRSGSTVVIKPRE